MYTEPIESEDYPVFTHELISSAVMCKHVAATVQAVAATVQAVAATAASSCYASCKLLLWQLQAVAVIAARYLVQWQLQAIDTVKAATLDECWPNS